MIHPEIIPVERYMEVLESATKAIRVPLSYPNVVSHWHLPVEAPCGCEEQIRLGCLTELSDGMDRWGVCPGCGMVALKSTRFEEILRAIEDMRRLGRG